MIYKSNLKFKQTGCRSCYYQFNSFVFFPHTWQLCVCDTRCDIRNTAIKMKHFGNEKDNVKGCSSPIIDDFIHKTFLVNRSIAVILLVLTSATPTFLSTYILTLLHRIPKIYSRTLQAIFLTSMTTNSRALLSSSYINHL